VLAVIFIRVLVFFKVYLPAILEMRRLTSSEGIKKLPKFRNGSLQIVIQSHREGHC